MAGMDDSELRSRQSKRWWLGPAIAALVLAMPVLYALSAGPFVYLYTRGAIEARSPLHKLYYPLQWSQIQCPPFMGIMNRYGTMWRYNPPLPPATPPPSPPAATASP